MVTGKKGRWIRPVDRMIGGMIRSRFWSQGFVSTTAVQSAAEGELLAGMVADGSLRPVIDRRFTLDEAVEALAHQGEGHARGKIIVVPS
jgi:NADPH:quinone reductase-like Zn-dependent oxidoreductase